jgi:hypothetical protein
MAEKYEFDFQKFNVDTLYGKYDTTQLAAFGDLWLKKYEKTANSYNAVNDLTYSAKVYSGFSDSQKNYLTRFVREFTPEGIQYEKDFLLWYNSRPDIQEIYTWAFNDSGNNFMYLQHPTKNTWSYKGDSDWDSSWEQTPANSNMFWRVCGDWNVRKFVAVNRETTYSEGDLVVLRTPFIGNWDYDPLWDRQNMPDKTVLRIGTILEMTSSIHRNSRAGKGSRAVQVLWNGTTETKQVPERVLKHLERKRRTKK